MSKPIVGIENWAVVRRGSYAAFEELQPGSVLTGKVFGHSRLQDAKTIYTSPIVSIDLPNRMVETRNTLYQLGKVSEHYKNSEECKSWDCDGSLRTAA